MGVRRRTRANVQAMQACYASATIGQPVHNKRPSSPTPYIDDFVVRRDTGCASENAVDSRNLLHNFCREVSRPRRLTSYTGAYMKEPIYNRRLPTSKNCSETVSMFAQFGSFQLCQTSADGNQLKISAGGLPALILAIGAAYGISALWGMIQVFGH